MENILMPTGSSGWSHVQHDGLLVYCIINMCFCTVYISEKQLLVLNFRGLSFEFRIDPKLEVSEQLKWICLLIIIIII